MSNSQRYPTPLRYPGGKQRLSGFFERLIRLNGLEGCRYIEPFAGGGGVGLSLLAKGVVGSIHLNDLDRSIYAFWYSLKHYNSELCDRIRSTRISLAEWDRQKAVQRRKASANLFDLGFSTFYLNRTNRSGIIRGGMIGGRSQSGEWTLKSRFDKKRMIDRIQSTVEICSKISISNKNSLSDGDFLFGADSNSLIYLDPPYFEKSDRLYMNHLTSDDHSCLERSVRACKDCQFVITYDTAPAILSVYAGYKRRFLQLAHTAGSHRVGQEVMFFSDQLRIPRKIP